MAAPPPDLPVCVITHLSNNASSLFLSDVDSRDELEQNRQTSHKIQVYVPVGETIRLPLTSSVAYSYQQGSIRGFIDRNLLSAFIDLGAVGAGDMLKAIYDPTTVAGDAFDADNHAYDPTTSGMVATDTQAAIDEIDFRVDALEVDSHPALTLNAGGTTQDSSNLVGQELELVLATTTTDGVLSAADKTKLDGITPGATATPLTATPPVDVDKSAAVVGVSLEAARADHKHNIATAAAIELTDSTNAEGVATSLSRSDHTHAHGNRGGGTLHADFVGDAGAGGTAGFVLAPAAGDAAAGRFLSADGTWDVPSGSVGGSSLILFGANSVSSSTTTRYLYPGNSDHLAQTSVIQFESPRGGTLKNLRVVQNSPSGNGNLIVYTIRVAGVVTALAVSMASTSTSGADLVDTAAVIAGDFIDVVVTKAATVGSSPTDILLSLELE